MFEARSTNERIVALVQHWQAWLLVGFACWGVALMRLNYRTGELATSFLHGPLLVFHEAGHVIFRLFGDWMAVMGGTLGQLIMPAVLCAALLIKNGDRFGASIGAWLFGVSVLDIAPYLYDAAAPQLTLLNGESGEAGGHDWIYLLDSLGWLGHSQALGTAVYALGCVLVSAALAWGAREVWRLTE